MVAPTEMQKLNYSKDIDVLSENKEVLFHYNHSFNFILKKPLG